MEEKNKRQPERAPYNFGWVVEGEIAGMGAPFLSGTDGDEEIAFLEARGIGAVVSLTHSNYSEVFSSLGFAYLHEPIPDMGIPPVAQLDRILSFVSEQVEDGKGVVVHCTAGVGRTGTILACYLVTKGDTAWEALDLLRRLRPGSVETMVQEKMVIDYYARLLEKRVAQEEEGTE